MRYSAIRHHLKPYAILARRRTTINHAFAAAIAPCDEYNDGCVRQAISDLNQNPDGDLRCVYCDLAAETWDHVYATVRDANFSGHGHRLGNLLPCCKRCNSAKGNKAWDKYLQSMNLTETLQTDRHSRIAAYLSKYKVDDPTPATDADYVKLNQLKADVLKLMGEADCVAAQIRARNAGR